MQETCLKLLLQWKLKAIIWTMYKFVVKYLLNWNSAILWNCLFILFYFSWTKQIFLLILHVFKWVIIVAVHKGKSKFLYWVNIIFWETPKDTCHVWKLATSSTEEVRLKA